MNNGPLKNTSRQFFVGLIIGFALYLILQDQSVDVILSSSLNVVEKAASPIFNALGYDLKIEKAN